MQGGLIGSICFLAFLLAIGNKAQSLITSEDLKGSVPKKSASFYDNNNTKPGASEENVTEMDSGLTNHLDKYNLSDSHLHFQNENASLPDLKDHATANEQLLEEITPQVFEGNQYRVFPAVNSLQFTTNSTNILPKSHETSLKDRSKIFPDTNDNMKERSGAASSDDDDSKFQVQANLHGLERLTRANDYFNDLGYPYPGVNFAQSQTNEGGSNPYNSGYLLSPYNSGLPGLTYNKDHAHGGVTDNAIGGESLTLDLKNNGFGLGSSEFDGFSLGSVEAAMNSLRTKKASAISSRVIPQNEIIFLHQIPGAENSIKCSQEGEMHNLWVPPHLCMVCACINQGRYLRPICTRCAGCMASKYPNTELDTLSVPSEDLMVQGDQMPPPQLSSQVSCDPLPMNRPFQNPLNPCQICVCKGSSALEDIQIMCLENPQCVIPPDIVNIPPSSDPPAPVPLPTCAQLPKNVMFPHPQDRCKICKCINHLPQFGSTEPQVLCVSRPECGTIIPETPFATPEKPISPNLVPYPNLNLSPTEFLLLNPELYPGQSKLPISETGIFPAPPGSNALGVQQTQNVDLTPSDEGYVLPKEPVSFQPETGSIMIKEETQVPPSWSSKVKDFARLQGPLPGPPPHDSCKPYSPNTPFEHPWDTCQTCVCSDYHSAGHVTIEVNCYTKPSCCIERSFTSSLVSGSKLESLPPPVPSHGHLHIVDKICEFKSFGAEFVNPRDYCQLCSCELFGNLVVPVCKHSGRSECAVKQAPNPGIRVVYIEPKCKQRLPHQPFDVNCNRCVCLPVYNFVIAKCTLQPNCRKLPRWPGIGLGSSSTVSPARLETISFQDASISPSIAEGLQTVQNYQLGPSYVAASTSKPGETVLLNHLLMNNQAPALTKAQLPGINYLSENSVLVQEPYAQAGPGNLWSEAQVNENSIRLKDDQFSKNFLYPSLQTAPFINTATTKDTLVSNAANQYKNYNLLGSSEFSQANIVPGSLKFQNIHPSQPVPVSSSIFYPGRNLRMPQSEGLSANDYYSINSNQYSYLPDVNHNLPSVLANQKGLERLPTMLEISNFETDSNDQFVGTLPLESYKSQDMLHSSDFKSPSYPADHHTSNYFHSYDHTSSAPTAIAGSDVYETVYPTPHRQRTSVFKPGPYAWSTSSPAIAESSTIRDSSTQNYAQVQLNTGRPVTRSGRGKCQYEGDMYHEKCQACYCSRDSYGELNSVCLGNPCTN